MNQEQVIALALAVGFGIGACYQAIMNQIQIQQIKHRVTDLEEK